MSKGISPIIASVLLLAVTLSVASIFSGWGPSMVKELTDSTSTQAHKTVDCNRAEIELVSAKHYTDTATAVVIRNKGTSRLDALEISAWKDNLPITNGTVIELSRGNFTTENISTDQKPDTIKAFSKNCTSVQDTLEDIS